MPERTTFVEGPGSSCEVKSIVPRWLNRGLWVSQIPSIAGEGKPMSTDEWLLTRGWWPTKGSEPRERYVGTTAAGVACHAQIVETQKTTPMAHASMPANSEMFAKSGISGALTFRIGAYSYKITQMAARSVYSASDGTQSVTTPLDWVFVRSSQPECSRG